MICGWKELNLKGFPEKLQIIHDLGFKRTLPHTEPSLLNVKLVISHLCSSCYNKFSISHLCLLQTCLSFRRGPRTLLGLKFFSFLISVHLIWYSSLHLIFISLTTFLVCTSCICKNPKSNVFNFINSRTCWVYWIQTWKQC